MCCLKSIFFNNFLRMTPCLVNIITLATQLSGCKRSAPPLKTQQRRVRRLTHPTRLWFALQRWKEYGYRPFITEINATVEISGGRDE
ncbi:DUF3289 family protein [Siccibacter colletis]|uniref:DUF3289 family protein n=1 Tax=Siccibacter colletis TaxID=1505757 RepID=UPI0028BDB2AD|nr:DUF3289 family protein [Siccibacter colletis]WNN47807.1 DUF3289 family protein [Siccibacter colletis]